MFEELSESYNSVVESFNQLATTMEVTSDQINYIMGAIKVGAIIAAIIFIILLVVIFAMNKKIDDVRDSNDQIRIQLEQITLLLKGENINGTDDIGSNEGDNGRGELFSSSR